MTDDTGHSSTDSNRSRLKDGALAATALAVGAGAATSTATAQEAEEAVVHGHDYYPDVDFEVVSQLQTSVKNDILDSFDDEFADPDDWEAFAIHIDVDGTAGVFGYLFTDEDELDVSEGDSGTFEDTASFRNPEQNLMEVDPGL